MQIKNHRHFFMMALIVLVVIPCFGMLSGCQQEVTKGNEETNRVVYVCSQSKEIFTGPLVSLPAMNPKTGERTLQRGLYCKNCNTWHVVPPLELVGGNQGLIKCNKTNLALVPDGPFPKNAQHIEVE